MNVHFMKHLDTIDRRILKELQRDADQSLESLGAAVGLSRNACWRRIRTLEDAGVIKGRVTLLDAAKLGLGLPEIMGVYRMSGDLDYLIRARVADMAGYDRLYQALIRKVPLSDVSASFVMEEIKETTELPL